MNAKTDPPPTSGQGANPSESEGGTATGAQSATSEPRRKPRISLFIATAGGLGYLPKAPGTWGSLAGVATFFIYFAFAYFDSPTDSLPTAHDLIVRAAWMIGWAVVVCIFIAGLGVWVSNRTAEYSGTKDPQFVVIDEVSGQFVSLFIGAILPIRWSIAETGWPGYPAVPHSALNWKYLLLGFILFRVFDIWKPFPARQAESLPGGWGIMADDWMAGIYAGLGLWIARTLGL
ncbi:MAG TPA: phosphatidylglycerophosphatase A [Candidatus Acidoferrum sp.]|nr:phosphatidylglycerophosphatase A [Candidatus Acidoferrum sp.]